MDKDTRLVRVVLAVLVVGLLAQRWLVLDRFAFRYTDDDQAVMWYGATEISHLRIHEPRFYGQDYNTMLEAALAAPLVALRVPHAYALPLVTSLLALTPFLLFALLAHRRGLHLTTVACLALPLMLPLRFHMVTAMPRGFVTGAFAASLAVCCALSRQTRGRAFLFGLLAVLSWSVLPNSLLITVPAAVELVFRQRRDRRLLAAAALGSAVAWLVHLGVQAFYVFHPPREESLYAYEDFAAAATQSAPRLLTVLSEPQRFLGDILPLLGASRLAAAVALIALLSAPLWLWRARHRGVALAGAAGALVLLAAMASGRVHLGSASVFYPWSRHFLPLPSALLLHALWLDPRMGTRARAGWAAIALAVCAMGVAMMELRDPDGRIAREIAVPQAYLWHARTDVVADECRRIATDLRSTHTRLALFKHSQASLLNYACAATFDDDSLATLCPEYDRRAWRVREELRAQPGRVLLVGYGTDVEERAGRKLAEVRRLRPSVLLARTGDRPVGEVASMLKLHVRPLPDVSRAPTAPWNALH